MKYLKLAAVLAGFFLAAGMASASLLDSFGVISGEADVEGPTFWVAPGNDLLINEEPDTTASYSLDGESFEAEVFDNQELDSLDWYPVEAELYVRARLDEDESDVNEADLELNFYSFEESSRNSICTGNTVEVDSSEYEVYSLTCQGEVETPVDGFQYQIEADDGDAYYRITTNGETRVEVNAQE